MNKATTYPIPRGWRQVTRGRTRKGDKGWDCVYRKFTAIARVDWPVDMFCCVIRRVKGGAK